MDCIVHVKIYEALSRYKYDSFLLADKKIVNYKRIPSKKENLKAGRKIRRRIKIHVDGILVHYIVQEFRCSETYCEGFSRNFLEKTGNGSTVKFLMLTPKKQIIDYDWNYKINFLVRERCELDHTLSWLSTLGGAFSALGDYFVGCAETAGKISYHQLGLAMRLKDPNIASRCRLYFSLSLIQRRRYKVARRIISEEYYKAKNDVVVDGRLLKMCKGIWSKLQYEHEVHRRTKQISKLEIREVEWV